MKCCIRLADPMPYFIGQPQFRRVYLRADLKMKDSKQGTKVCSKKFFITLISAGIFSVNFIWMNLGRCTLHIIHRSIPYLQSIKQTLRPSEDSEATDTYR